MAAMAGRAVYFPGALDRIFLDLVHGHVVSALGWRLLRCILEEDRSPRSKTPPARIHPEPAQETRCRRHLKPRRLVQPKQTHRRNTVSKNESCCCRLRTRPSFQPWKAVKFRYSSLLRICRSRVALLQLCITKASYAAALVTPQP